jgi:glycosyltransferase involved in cell wall biosynthesis
VVVVNNNSTDETERVLDRFMDRLPLRRAFEPAPGLSHARNTAVRNADGDYIVWTDDDVVVDNGWLVAYESAIERWPEAAVFGGPVRPRFEGTLPPWLSSVWRTAGDAFAVRDLGSAPFELDKRRTPYGPNYVVRRREQNIFSYDPNLGRKHGAGALGEETAVISAILSSGGTGWWVPDAAVEHWIPKERQTVSYLRDYYMLLGRTYRLWELQDRSMPLCNDRWLWPKTLQAEFAYIIARLSGNPDRWMKRLVDASMLWGAIRQ